MSNPTCASCRWFEPHFAEAGGDPFGTCRRSAPIPTRKEDNDVLWPTTHGTDDWCGEHKPKEPK